VSRCWRRVAAREAEGVPVESLGRTRGFHNFVFLPLLSTMRRAKTFDSSVSQVAETAPPARTALRRSVSDIPVSKTYAGWPEVALVMTGAALAAVFFFDRSSVLAKGLSVVPPLGGLIVLLYKKAHLGTSPVFWLALALALHGAGDVVIKIAGVIESMPFFLLGHILYCRSFARGCDISLRRLSQFENLKKAAIAGAGIVAVTFWFLLHPSFQMQLKPVLLCYILALCGMFVLSLFSRSKLLILGAGLYLISDSLIAFHEFVFPTNSFFSFLDLFAWPVYWLGQLFITLGALNSFSDMQLHSDPRSKDRIPTFVNIFGLVGLLVALRRLWQ
jgi:multidrug transporter EmrE-like cation transporter